MIKNIELIKPIVFFIQETLYDKKGLFKVENYEVFESIRQGNGGSILTGAHKRLNPVLISDSSEDDIEVLVIEGELNGKKVRFINGYGPQEYANVDTRIKFFARIEEEVIIAKLQGAMICIEMDANAKLGEEVIPNDPNARSGNGELLYSMVVRNNLVVCNGTSLCKGIITRKRITINGEEKSAIDFIITCEELFNHMIEMEVDEKKKYTVAKYSKQGKNIKVVETDHNMNIAKFSINLSKHKSDNERKEVFNYKDEEGKKKFKLLTSSNKLSKCFETSDIVTACKKWQKEFNNILHRAFKKVRVGGKVKKNNEVIDAMKAKQKLIKIREQVNEEIENGAKNAEILQRKHENEDLIEEADKVIAELTALKNVKLITEHFEKLSNTSGEFSIPKMWNLKKKIFPRNSDVPMAMKDHKGNLIRGKEGLKQLYKDTYIERLSEKPINECWTNIKQRKEELFQRRLEISSLVKSEDWRFGKIEKVCKN